MTGREQQESAVLLVQMRILDQCPTRLGVASTRANIVQVVGEVAGVAALAVGDTTSQEVKDS